jgi:hypothetical protein
LQAAGQRDGEAAEIQILRGYRNLAPERLKAFLQAPP